jgi:hypothetical protein
MFFKETWLDQRGGRTLDDVRLGDGGMEYVWMGNGSGGKEKVYIPSGQPEDTSFVEKIIPYSSTVKR